MRTRASQPYVAALLACLLALVLPALDFQGGQTVTLSGFQTRGTDDDGKAQWELHGKTARLRGGLYRLDTIQLVVYLEDGDRVTITSPRCIFDQARGIARSDAPIKVVSEEMTLEGEGYDFDINRKLLRVRSRVKMKLKKAGAHLSAEEVFGPIGGAAAPPVKKSTTKRNLEP
jgi:hypothetical protein